MASNLGNSWFSWIDNFAKFASLDCLKILATTPAAGMTMDDIHMLLIQCTTVSWWKSSKTDSFLGRDPLISWLVNLPPLTYPRNKGLITGLIKGNQWLTSHSDQLAFSLSTVIQSSYIISASPLTIISKDLLNIQLVTHFQGISWNRWGWWVNCWMVRSSENASIFNKAFVYRPQQISRISSMKSSLFPEMLFCIRIFLGNCMSPLQVAVQGRVRTSD